MKQFSVKALLGVIAVAAVVTWWMDPGFHVIHDEVSPGHGRIMISGKRERKTNQYKLRIKYIPGDGPPSEIPWSPALIIEDVHLSRLSFDSLTDTKSGIWCVFDTSGKQFVFLATPGAGNSGNGKGYWHPGIHIGWARGLWISHFRLIKSSHPEIPYATLPTELRIEANN